MRYAKWIIACGLAVSAWQAQNVTGTILGTARRKPGGGRLRSFPKTMLWAWERPEDLRSIKDGEAGVAFLARSLYLRGGEVLVEPRRQPLQAPEGAALMSVVRIDSDRAQPPDLSSELSTKTAAAIAEVSNLPRVGQDASRRSARS